MSRSLACISDVTISAIEVHPELLPAAFFGQDPRARAEGRIVPDVLEMAAFKLSAPMVLVIPVEGNNFSKHALILEITGTVAAARRFPP
jgi:hypothetical protein